MSPPPIRRSTVEPRPNYRDYKDELRHDFLYCCAYCTIAEVEAGGIAFEIDHYLPQAHYKNLAADFDNLLWSCERCNRAKSDFYPGKMGVPTPFYVVRCDRENPGDHYAEDRGSFELTHHTPAGEFTLSQLRLNRCHLVKLRRLRARFGEADEAAKRSLARVERVRLDSVRPRLRGRFRRLREAVKSATQEQAEKIRESIRREARSLWLDADSGRRMQNRERDRYLRSLRIIGGSE